MKRGAFVHPEYQIFLAVLLVLLWILVPQFARLRQNARNLQAISDLRSALKRYESAHHGADPARLEDLAKEGKYLKEIPAVRVTDYHDRSSQVSMRDKADDSGGWVYDNRQGKGHGGKVWINCTHTDSKGKAWAEY